MTMSDRRTVVLSAMMASVGPISMALLAPALPEIALEFGTTAGSVGRTLTLFLIGFAMGQLIVGPIADRYGRRPVALAFAAIYMAASIFALFASGLDMLIAARFFQGIGVSSGLIIARAIVRDAYEGASAARIFSAIAVCNAVVPMISPGVGAISAEYLGWHALFAQMVLLGVAVFIALLFLQRETLPSENRAASIEPCRMLRVYRGLLSDPSFLAPAVMMGTGIGTIYIVSILLPFILIGQIGLSNTISGGVMGLQTLGYIVSSIIYNRLHGRLSSRICLRISSGLFLSALALLLLLVRLAPLSTATYMVPVVMWVAGNAFATPILTSAGLQGFPHSAGAAAALLGFTQIVFASIGTFLIEVLPFEANHKMVVVFTASAIIISVTGRLAKRR